jgi:uncharacterized protein
MNKKSSRDLELTSPIPFHTGSNGEFVPRPPTARDQQAEELFRRYVDEHAPRMGTSRREFIRSACGTATALLVVKQVYGCGGGDSGGRSGAADGGVGATLDAGAMSDPDQACEQLAGPEFIFDVQTHHVNPEGPWRTSNAELAAFLGFLPQASCGQADSVDCYDRDHYIREMFINSDTSVAVLSALPAPDERQALLPEEADATRKIIEMMSGSRRLAIHGMVLPDLGQSQLDGMQRLAEEVKINAWKVYTPVGGWFLDDEAVGVPFIEKASALGVNIICCHKGLPLPGFLPQYADPRDVGVAAKMFPDMNFVIYHSGYEQSTVEGPYNPAAPAGIDRLIKSLEDNGIGPNQNVYAELGSTWLSVMSDPIQASHVLGKLIKHVGEDRVVWGTDSIWYGSPQPQIDAFRSFQIASDIREANGYGELTAEVKAKIFGLSSAALYGIDPAATLCEIKDDQLALRRQEASERPLPRFYEYGPQSRREFFAFLRSRGGLPG